MKTEDRIKLISDFTAKVLQYPKGSKGFDPVDFENLKYQISKFENENRNTEKTYTTTQVLKAMELARLLTAGLTTFEATDLLSNGESESILLLNTSLDYKFSKHEIIEML